MRRRELDHLAGADEQHLGLAQVLEQLRGEAHRGRRHADRVAPISVEVRTSLATANERWNICCSVRAERAGAVGLAHRLLQLAEDLRLAEHHRVEAAGDAERVARRRAALEHVGVLRAASALATPPMPASQSTAGVDARRVGADVDLGAVAGRDDRDLARPLEARCGRPQRRRQLLRARTRTGRADRAARSCG